MQRSGAAWAGLALPGEEGEEEEEGFWVLVGPRVAAGTSRAWCSLGRAVFSLGGAPLPALGAASLPLSLPVPGWSGLFPEQG